MVTWFFDWLEVVPTARTFMGVALVLLMLLLFSWVAFWIIFFLRKFPAGDGMGTRFFDDLRRNRRLILVFLGRIILGLLVFIGGGCLIVWSAHVSMPFPAEPAHSLTSPCQGQHSQKQEEERACDAVQLLP